MHQSWHLCRTLARAFISHEKWAVKMTPKSCSCLTSIVTVTWTYCCKYSKEST